MALKAKLKEIEFKKCFNINSIIPQSCPPLPAPQTRPNKGLLSLARMRSGLEGVTRGLDDGNDSGPNKNGSIFWRNVSI